MSELIGPAEGGRKQRIPERLNWRLVIALWINFGLWGLLIGAVGCTVR